MISRDEYIRRRENFISMMGNNCITIIANSDEQTRNSDVNFPFRSHSDFIYLTGFDEPNAVAVFFTKPERLDKVETKVKGKYFLFCSEKDFHKELWNGEIIGLDNAVKEYDADDAFPIDDIGDILPGLLENKDKLVYNMGSHDYLDSHLISWINHIKENSRYGCYAPHEIISPDHVLHEMRLFKSRAEITLMKKAAKVTAKAHARAMKNCKPNIYEYEVEAELLYEFNKSGCKFPAYSSIVAGGSNACVLHYINNDNILNDGDLLLIDAGSEYKGYAADVTRTFPVNGKFSLAQKKLYEVVLNAQLKAIDAVAIGVSWNLIHEVAVEHITQGLLDLKILTGDLETAISEEKYKEFFMHRTGHWLGLDVHDVGEYKIHDNWRELEKNMVLTIEPGIYIPKNKKSVPKEYRGIGIRIEDDVVVTADGALVLTANIPKTVEDIELLMAKNK